jgi:glycine dehydrogenase
MIKSLTALDIANASLLDEGTAAAEAMVLAFNHGKAKKHTFLVDRGVLPQTVAVLRQRAKGFGIKVVQTELRTPQGIRLPFGKGESGINREDVMAVLVQYPDVDGRIIDWQHLADEIHKDGGLVVAATDLLALTMIKPPGEWGADIAVGNSARFGVPPGYGGPHAAFFAVRDGLKRKIAGRLVGLSRDSNGKPAYRLALQTREQHIRRDKATSNVCTAQALLANMSAMYAVYHGPTGLRKIAAKTHALTRLVKYALTTLGIRVINRDGAFFDTLTIDLSTLGIGAVRVHSIATESGLNLRRISDSRVGFSLDETVSIEEITDLVNIFKAAKESGKGAATGESVPFKPRDLMEMAETIHLDASTIASLEIHSPSPALPSSIPSTAEAAKSLAKSEGLPDITDMSRSSKFLTQPIFNSHQSETQLLRYITSLESKDLSLAHAMIPLGSCTMKLNSTSSMMLLSKPEFGALHPLCPEDQARGYDVLIRELERDLCLLTGFPAVSLQPNSGAQGEFAGLSIIRAYLDSINQSNRDVCLIPNSAHGTNPASAIMAGMRVVAVKNKLDGSIDMEDLRKKADDNKDRLAAFMVTYPSTFGVFEDGVQEACNIVHSNGGQVYMDGANMQAQVGLTNPALIGADVTHLNLHKTFSIPHGGGGPGVGPICCAEHLAPYLPGHPLASVGGEQAIDPISSAPHGSASILTIAWAYIKMLGWKGLRDSSMISLLSANFMAKRLAPHYKLRYTNNKDRVAHEFLLDFAEFQKYVSVSDVAKRLSDYGFHAPTCSWPISTGMLIEPTESESLEEINRFCDAMISIRGEIQDIIDGKQDAKDNTLKNAPHTVETLLSDQWSHPYSRELAAYPVPGLRKDKFWPASGRVDDAHGDLNLVCECGSVDDYAE